MSPCPEHLEALDIDWLNAALGTRGDDYVTAFDAETVGVGEGFMAQLARIAFKRRDGREETLIAKIASRDPNIRQMAAAQGYYQREHGFYTELAGQTPARVPTCHYARLEDPAGPFVLLLEDFAPATAVDQVGGAGRDLSAAVIHRMAKIHAAWWNSATLAALPWAQPLVQTQSAAEGLAMLNAALARNRESGAFARYPHIDRLSRKLTPLFRMEPPPPFPFTLTHGDLRADNVFELPGGEVGLIDWQLCGVGQPASDVARWLAQSVTVEDRRATEEALLRSYHETLCAEGVRGYSWRQFQRDYQLNLVVMLIMFSMGVEHVDTSHERAAEVIHQMYARLDAALADHEVENLLNVLPYLIPVIKLTTWIKARISRR